MQASWLTKEILLGDPRVSAGGDGTGFPYIATVGIV